MNINTPEYLIIHHTGGSDANPLQDSSNFTFEACNELHKNNPNVNLGYPSSLGYYIGYHYYIEKDGSLHQGRLDTDEGAHTVGYNQKSIGICLAGNFDLTLPTEAQVATLKALLKAKTAQFNIPSTKVVPHRTFAKKTCYGQKLSDSWAASLLTDAPVVDKAAVIAKASALLAEAMRLIATIS